MNKSSIMTLALAVSSVSAFQPMTMKASAGIKAKASKKYSDAFLRTLEPNSGAQGDFFVKETEGISKALPWVTAPDIAGGQLVGDYGFDPLGLAKTFDVSWLRAAELKHGRLGMLATVGFLAPELVQHPAGFEGFKFPAEFTEMNAIKALSTVPQFGLAQIIIACGLAEIASFGKNYSADYAFDDTLSPKERENIKTGKVEALVGAAKTAYASGYIAEDVEILKGDLSSVGDLGFDPLGFADNGINAAYAEAEIKHGRLAMIAAIGMLLQSFYSPDTGIIQQTAEWAKSV
jgi:hypothetical protein